MMKVFVVDDEIVIREGIRNSFPWEESGYTLVGEASDGEMALPMIRDANPDLLLTDLRMPFMDGIQLCREVQCTMPWIGVIILSGYEDFEFARQAIQLQVCEYLLKPITADELRQALDRASRRLMQERQERESLERMRKRLQSGNQFMKDKLLASLYTEGTSEQETQETLRQMRALGIPLLASCYAVIDAAFQPPDKGREVLYALAEHSGNSVHVSDCRTGARVLVLGDSDDDTEERAYAFAASALQEMDRQGGCKDALFCVGETVHGLAEVCASMQSARHIRHMMNAARREDMRIVGVHELNELPPPSPATDVRPLYERLTYTTPENLPAVFAEYAASLGAVNLHSRLAVDYLRVEALMTATRLVREAGGDPSQVLDLDTYDRIMQQDEEESAMEGAQNLLLQALSYQQALGGKGKSMAAQARAYLAQHFTDPNLMLQDVAKAVCMSNSHFSTVFAQETGSTYTEYLTALRLSKAQELLKATEMKSSQIAFAVGYNDAHYFSYLFRKNLGMTPSEYRKKEK